METAGAVASVVGLAGAGAKIPITLFEVARKIGSTGAEMKATGKGMSLFCAVLKQLDLTLNKIPRKRCSIHAIAVTQEILDGCKDIFDKLESQSLELRQQVEWEARLR